MPGQRVLLSWSLPCGRCFQCVESNEHLCERHSPLTAGLGGHARVADAAAVVLTRDLIRTVDLFTSGDDAYAGFTCGINVTEVWVGIERARIVIASVIALRSYAKVDEAMDEWTIYRVTGQALRRLAET